MNFCIPKQFNIEYISDGVPYISGNTIIDKDGIVEMSVIDGVSRKSVHTYSTDNKIVLCSVKVGDRIVLKEQSEKVNGYHRFRVMDIGKYFITAVPDGGVMEI